MQRTSYVVAIGSNRRHGRYGAPAKVVSAAIAAMETAGLVLRARSRTIATPALGPAGRSFANTAVIVETTLDPPALLALLKRIERDFGRRRARRWGARVLDLDIILWSGGRWSTGNGLTIPHRAYASRDFVLRPLAEIAPRWRDPRSGLSMRQLRARLKRHTSG